MPDHVVQNSISAYIRSEANTPNFKKNALKLIHYEQFLTWPKQFKGLTAANSHCVLVEFVS
jgi:hypothetical protein